MTECTDGTAQQEDTASARLYELARLAQSQGGITLEEALSCFGRASMAFTILFLALPALTPIPGPFGMVFGSALALVATQVAMGRQAIWLPAFLGRRRLSSAAVQVVVRYSAPSITRIEAFVRPGRLSAFAGRTMQWLLAFPMFILAVIITLPIPFGNILPVMALVAISIALIARDGLMTLGALLLTVLSLALTILLIQLVAAGLSGFAF